MIRSTFALLAFVVVLATTTTTSSAAARVETQNKNGEGVKSDADGERENSRDNCSNFDYDCDDCLHSRDRCGFCIDSYGYTECRQGDYYGPDRGYCDNWVWDHCPVYNYPTSFIPPTPEYGSSDCSRHNDDCYDCTETYGCGWCDHSSTCEPGGPSGPSGDSRCPRQEWVYESYYCEGSTSVPTVDCSSGNGDCRACAEMDDCGYCESTGQCVDGNVVSATTEYCSSYDWAYSVYECRQTSTGTDDQCSYYDDSCYECLQNPSCGYCHSGRGGGTCESGSGEGPSTGRCPRWSFFSCSTTVPSYSTYNFSRIEDGNI